MERSTNSEGFESELQKTMKASLLAQIQGWKQREQVELLDRAGFPQRQIALMLGTSSKSISVRLAEIRKEARARRG